MSRPHVASLPLITLLLTSPALAQDDADAIAKKLSNPIASMISLPFQYNVDFNIGPENGTKHTLNIQPVIPSSLNANWNLITRVILPVVQENDVRGKSGSQLGLGDTTPTFFFSPKQPGPGGLIWGVGPAFLLPTATDDLLGAKKWGIGPSAVALMQKGHLTYGALVNHIWSFAGDEQRGEVCNTFLQPFLAKGFTGGWTLTGNFEASYNWKAEAWTVPFNLTVSKVTQIGGRPISFAGGVRYYFETPGDGPDWGIRGVMTFVFPK